MSTKEMGLLDCPVEILELISTYLCSHCAEIEENYVFNDGSAGSSNLLNLSSTCKRLYRAAQPTLFHSFSSFSSLELGVFPFLRALIARPDLQNVVREVNFGHILSSEDVYYIKTAVYSLNAAHLLRGWDDGDPADKLLGLILCFTPNVTDLRSTALPALPASDQAPAPMLWKLRQLYLEREPRPNDWNEILQFLPEVPNLKGLVANCLSGSRPLDLVGNPILRSNGPRLGNLRRLALPNSTLEPIMLSQLISECGPLESFYFSFDNAGGSRVFGNDETSPLEPWPALLKKRKWLRFISLSIEGIQSLVKAQADHPYLLRDFEYLEKLELDNKASLALVFHWQEHGNDESDSSRFLTDVLPASIRHLALRNAHTTLIGAVRGLVYAMKAGLFPKLTGLDLKERFGEVWSSKHAWIKHIPDLRSAFGEVDATLTVEGSTAFDEWDEVWDQ